LTQRGGKSKQASSSSRVFPKSKNARLLSKYQNIANPLKPALERLQNNLSNKKALLGKILAFAKT